MMGDDQDNREGNLGIGYRQIISLPLLGNGVAGVNGWLDRRITERGSHFHQVTTGVEWLGENIDLRLNGYLPLSHEKTYSIPNANPQGPTLVGTDIVVDTNGTLIEEPQHGLDLELGFELGQHFDFIKNHTDSFRIYGGGYYFNGDHTEDVAGWRTRFSTDVTENIQIGGRFQQDDERGSQGFLEATFRLPFGNKKSYRREGLRSRLDESPERDIDIVTGDVVTDQGNRVPVLNKETGAPQKVLTVDNTAAGGGNGSIDNPFNTLAAAQAAASAQTIIYVRRGDGTSTNQDQGILLDKTGQQLIGSGTNFIYDSGRLTTANGGTPTSILIAAAGAAPVIGNVNAGFDGVTITANDITVAGLTVDNGGTGRDGIVVKADGAAASATNITIKDVTTQNARMGIYLHGTNNGALSTLVQNSVMTSNSQHGIAVYDDTDDTFEVDLGGGSLGSTGNNVLAGNTLEDLAVEYDGRTLAAQNNWWGQATGADTDAPSIGIAPQIYYGAPINDGLVGHWTFDTEWTTNTTAYDRSGQGNNGSLQNGLTASDSISSPAGEALVFNSAVYVQLPNINNIRSFHFLANIDNSQTGASYLFDARAGLGQGWLYNISTGANWITMYANGINVAPLWASIPKDQWSRTYYESNIQFSDNVNLMSRFSNNQFSRGSLSDVRFYSRALTPSEISELYRMDTSSAVNTGSFLTSSP
ncbi:MAG: DUF1565 domain-containing protein [Micavibrio sp.]|nr:DUF1565 domain-containing protein [Micavibrio sp.]